ncbi:organic cation transporter protein-like [Crassostrea angulata]|uniref:organic cation transporter protein-like n=1 Tax=Magallana angulata TaxID=2784310 RepID=UPI0022B1CC1F|nr:organic cation transporter protein-like [Crassostrea angulata]
MAYDYVFQKIGSFGRYQKLIYLFQTLPVVFTAIQTYLSVFILYVPDHRCAKPNINETKLHMEGVNAINSSMLYSKCARYFNNLTMESLHQLFDPRTESYNQHYDYNNKLMHTKYISFETSADGNSTMHSAECKRWEYDTTEFEKTFVTENNLVCSKKLYRTHAIVFFMAGFTVGSLFIGIFSDRLGRKVAFIGSIVLYVGSNVSLSFAQEFWEFSALRLVSGVSVGGLITTCYVMDLELVGPDMRMLAGIVYMLFWGIGAILLTGMAYLIRDWRKLNLALALPTILFLFYTICVPESTRWLVVRGKREKAEKILRRIARRNNRLFQEPILSEEDGVDRAPQVSFITLWSHPRLLCNTVVFFFNWFVVALVFLGLSWNVNNLAGDVFLNFFLTSIAEIVGFLLCIPLLDRVGRKPVYVVSLFTGGFALLLTMVPVLVGSQDIQWVMSLLSLVGKVGSSAAFATIFLYSAELFPTVIRNTGLGIANFCARTGGMIAPYIPDVSQIVSGDFGRVLPMCIFGGLAIFAGFLSLLLPETNKQDLPETLEDAERIWLKGRRERGKDITVPPPSNSNTQHGDLIQNLNGETQQSVELEMLQPLNGET